MSSLQAMDGKMWEGRLARWRRRWARVEERNRGQGVLCVENDMSLEDKSTPSTLRCINIGVLKYLEQNFARIRGKHPQKTSYLTTCL